MAYNAVIVLVGAALLGLLCGVVGSFSVLRRRALLGDVLAHAALPGLAIAFLLTHSKSLPVLLFGALCSGLFGLVVLSYLRRQTRTKEDAAMGIVLAVLFGAGISLSRFVQNSTADGSHAGLDSFIFGKTAGMVLSDVLLTIGACAVAISVVVLLYKEFRLVCFDGGFAQSLGWNVALLDLAILFLLALAVIVGLPMVGVVMVAALTIIPPVTARLWVSSLGAMLTLAAAVGVVSAVVGVLISASAEGLPSGPLIVLSAAAIFTLSALFAPGRGLVAVAARLRRQRLQYGADTLARLAPLPHNETAEKLREQGVRSPASVVKFALAEKLVQLRDGQLEAV